MILYHGSNVELSDETSKMWRLSPKTIFEMYRQEKSEGRWCVKTSLLENMLSPFRHVARAEASPLKLFLDNALVWADGHLVRR